jgi:hypothetical protein
MNLKKIKNKTTAKIIISVKDNKIIIYLVNEGTKRFIPPNIASAEQECLTLTLKKALEFYHKSFGKSLSTSEVSTFNSFARSMQSIAAW